MKTRTLISVAVLGVLASGFMGWAVLANTGPNRDLPDDIRAMDVIECSNALDRSDFENEFGKLHWDHVFKEIKSEEQAEDIRAMRKFMESDDHTCHEKLAHWRAYDEKWYAPERAQRKAELEANIEEWKAMVEDTGPHIWDGVIGGVYFHIPRAHIWSGSMRGDGYAEGFNLIFHAPDMKSSDPDSPYGEHSDIAGVLKTHAAGGGQLRNHRCVGFEDRDECKMLGFARSYDKYQACSGFNIPVEEYYLARWRRACVPGEGIRNLRFTEMPPEYDEEVGAWSIGGKAFYKGDMEFPWYALVCEKFPKGGENALTEEQKRKRCHSGVQITDNVYFYYSFPRVLFWEHEIFNERIRKKLVSFIDDSQKDIKEQVYGYVTGQPVSPLRSAD